MNDQTANQNLPIGDWHHSKFSRTSRHKEHVGRSDSCLYCAVKRALGATTTGVEQQSAMSPLRRLVRVLGQRRVFRHFVSLVLGARTPAMQLLGHRLRLRRSALHAHRSRKRRRLAAQRQSSTKFIDFKSIRRLTISDTTDQKTKKLKQAHTYTQAHTSKLHTSKRKHKATIIVHLFSLFSMNACEARDVHVLETGACRHAVRRKRRAQRDDAGRRRLALHLALHLHLLLDSNRRCRRRSTHVC